MLWRPFFSIVDLGWTATKIIVFVFFNFFYFRGVYLNPECVFQSAAATRPQNTRGIILQASCLNEAVMNIHANKEP